MPGQWLSVKATTPEGEEMTLPPIRSRRLRVRMGHVAFCLNRVEEGFMSNYLCGLEEGAQISFQGPFGSFILRPPLRDSGFYCYGDGDCSVCFDVAHWLLADAERHQGYPVLAAVLGRARSRTFIIARSSSDWAAEHDNFHFFADVEPGGWRGVEGVARICAALKHLGEIVGMRTDMHAYICGLDKMVKAES